MSGLGDGDKSRTCFFQAEDGIRDAQESRGLGDVYKRQISGHECDHFAEEDNVYVGDSMFPDHHMHQKRIRAAQEDYYLLARAKRQFKNLNNGK